MQDSYLELLNYRFCTSKSSMMFKFLASIMVRLPRSEKIRKL